MKHGKERSRGHGCIRRMWGPEENGFEAKSNYNGKIPVSEVLNNVYPWERGQNSTQVNSILKNHSRGYQSIDIGVDLGFRVQWLNGCEFQSIEFQSLQSRLCNQLLIVSSQLMAYMKNKLKTNLVQLDRYNFISAQMGQSRKEPKRDRAPSTL